MASFQAEVFDIRGQKVFEGSLLPTKQAAKDQVIQIWGPLRPTEKLKYRKVKKPSPNITQVFNK